MPKHSSTNKTTKSQFTATLESKLPTDRKVPPGVDVSPAALERAKFELNAQYAKPVTALGVVEPKPGDLCPVCNGAGRLMENHFALPGHKQFGNTVPCPDPSHNEHRLRQLSMISNLYPTELKIRLNQVQEYHRPDKTVMLPYNTHEGKIIPLPRSNRAMLQKAREIVASPYEHGIVYILGPHGNGKTMTGQAIVNEINEAGKGPAMYINLIELIGYILEGYDKENGGPTVSQRYKIISRTPCLVIDEFDFGDGKNKVTEHTLKVINQLFNDRYRMAHDGTGLTIVIGNQPIKGLDLPALNSRFGTGWFDMIYVTAPDRRPAEKRKPR